MIQGSSNAVSIIWKSHLKIILVFKTLKSILAAGKVCCENVNSIKLKV